MTNFEIRLSAFFGLAFSIVALVWAFGVAATYLSIEPLVVFLVPLPLVPIVIFGSVWWGTR